MITMAPSSVRSSLASETIAIGIGEPIENDLCENVAPRRSEVIGLKFPS